MILFFSTLCPLCLRRTKEAEFLLQGDKEVSQEPASANGRPGSGQRANQSTGLSPRPL